MVTLDTCNLAWRPTDLNTSYLPFRSGAGCQIGFSDPVFNRMYQYQLAKDDNGFMMKLVDLLEVLSRPRSITGAAKLLRNIGTARKSEAWLDIIHSGTYREWADLKILKKHWDDPIVLKGIQTVEDAHRAIEYGVSGIIVSNHGGGQLDGAIASLDALSEIASDEKVKSSDLTLLFDSGIQTGSDILKALALGAKPVLIGRPYIYGLAIGSKEGIKHILGCLLADMDNMLGNMGKTSLSELSRVDLQMIAKL